MFLTRGAGAKTMPSFARFKSEFRNVADARDVRVFQGSLRYQHNVIRLNGSVDGTIYVRPSRYLHWRVTKGALAAMNRRRNRNNATPCAIVLLHQTNKAGFVLPDDIVAEHEENWDYHPSEGQYGIRAEDVKQALRFESLDELMGILRTLFFRSSEA